MVIVIFTLDNREKAYEETLNKMGFLNVYDWLASTDFFTAPASTKYHGVCDGGLAYHSYMVYMYLKKFGLIWDRPESPAIIGLLHDVCKIGLYKKGLNGEYIYDYATHSVGHGKLSVEILKGKMDLTKEEEVCIRYHMGEWINDLEDGEMEYSKIIKLYPNVFWTHTVDMYVSQVLQI